MSTAVLPLVRTGDSPLMTIHGRLISGILKEDPLRHGLPTSPPVRELYSRQPSRENQIAATRLLPGTTAITVVTLPLPAPVVTGAVTQLRRAPVHPVIQVAAAVLPPAPPGLPEAAAVRQEEADADNSY